jgi:N-acetyl-gamma-glutamyl-phosphate reductase
MADRSAVRPVAVVGASGFSGAELLRLLAGHPGFTVVAAGAGEAAGSPIGDLYPHLAPAYGKLRFESLGGPDEVIGTGAEAAFLALPHGQSSRLAPELVDSGIRVVDLAGDFRLEAEDYPTWYGFEHPAPAWLGKAVYGLPELFPGEVDGADLVANPGCYPVATALALGPLLRAGMVDPGSVVVDAKSGVSGAGRRPTETVHYAMTEGGVRPYRVGNHQHVPEIERTLERLARVPVGITFVPHLIPAVRGVLVTCYAHLSSPTGIDSLVEVLRESYATAPFVRVLAPGRPADSKRVTGSNVCEVGVGVDARRGVVVVTAAVDNLVKGAAGQALQNLNLMFGLPEELGLPTLAVYP